MDLMQAALGLGVGEESWRALLQRAEGPPERPITAYARRVTMAHRDWLVRDERRRHLQAAWAALFERHDVLLTPVVPVAAPAHDPGAATVDVDGTAVPYWNQVAWAGLASLSYLPAASVPAGRTERALPVGVQVVGPRLEDRTVVAAAGVLEELLGGYEPPPAAVDPGPAPR